MILSVREVEQPECYPPRRPVRRHIHQAQGEYPLRLVDGDAEPGDRGTQKIDRGLERRGLEAERTPVILALIDR